MKVTVRQIRESRIPQLLGLCATNTVELCSYINEATQRLLFAGGKTGWYGGWAKMAFNTTQANPYITAPREVARLINIDVCDQPIPVQNEFFEFLEFGIGLQGSDAFSCACNPNCCQTIQAFDRGMFALLTDITPGNTIRLFYSNAADVGKSLFFNAIDSNGMQIYSLNNGVQVNGFFMNLAPPFVDSPMAINSINGVQKDITLGPVSIYQVDASTGAQSLLATLAPTEQGPSYRRYYLNGLPDQCPRCTPTAGVIQVTAMAKREYVPVSSDTDYLLIGNIPALKLECQSIRFGEMDDAKAMQMSQIKHLEAVRLLNKELVHYLGEDKPAIQVKPWGNATLELSNLQMI